VPCKAINAGLMNGREIERCNVASCIEVAAVPQARQLAASQPSARGRTCDKFSCGRNTKNCKNPYVVPSDLGTEYARAMNKYSLCFGYFTQLYQPENYTEWPQRSFAVDISTHQHTDLFQCSFRYFIPCHVILNIIEPVPDGCF
jgi:hypothetical protein